MFSAPVIGTGPNLLGRLLEAVTRIRASLELAHELKGLNSDQARLLLEQPGLITRPEAPRSSSIRRAAARFFRRRRVGG